MFFFWGGRGLKLPILRKPQKKKRCTSIVAPASRSSAHIAHHVNGVIFIFIFILFFFSHFYFPASGQAVVTGVFPSPPRFLPSIFIAHRVQQSRCSSIFHRMLLTHALALSASQFEHKKKSQRIYTSMHSAGLELTKLSYTRLEDNLIRHRGDRLSGSIIAPGLSHVVITRGVITPIWMRNYSNQKVTFSGFFWAPRCHDSDGCDNPNGCYSPTNHGYHHTHFITVFCHKITPDDTTLCA